jgi:hypothetical protein
MAGRSRASGTGSRESSLSKQRFVKRKAFHQLEPKDEEATVEYDIMQSEPEDCCCCVKDCCGTKEFFHKVKRWIFIGVILLLMILCIRFLLPVVLVLLMGFLSLTYSTFYICQQAGKKVGSCMPRFPFCCCCCCCCCKSKDKKSKIE